MSGPCLKRRQAKFLLLSATLLSGRPFTEWLGFPTPERSSWRNNRFRSERTGRSSLS